MSFTKKRWTVLAMYSLINLCVGLAYAWSIFSGPLSAKLGADDLSIVYSIASSFMPLAMITGSYLNEKFGPKKLFFFCGIIYGLGVIASGLVTTAWMLMLSFGLCVGFSGCMIYGVIIGNAIKMFPDKRGLAGGIATATFGLSSMLLSSAGSYLLVNCGVSAAFIILGIIFTVAICVCSLFVKPAPSGFAPEGWVPPERTASVQSGDMRWREMMATPAFYIMFLLMACGAVCGTMIISQASPMAQKITGMSATESATVVTVLAVFNTAGRLVCGALSDKIGRINTLVAALLLSLAGMTLAMTCSGNDYIRFGAGVSLIGIGFGSFLGVFPGLCADRFGARHNTLNYGIVFIGYSAAGFIGPSIAGGIYKATGGYAQAFAAAACAAGLGIILTAAYRRVNRANKRAGSM